MKIAIASDGLPLWPGDDVEFVCAKLATLKIATNISAFLDLIGIRARDVETQQPTREYFRVRAAFHAAMARGRVRRLGMKWGLVPKTSIVETATTRAGRAVLAAAEREMRERR